MMKEKYEARIAKAQELMQELKEDGSASNVKENIKNTAKLQKAIEVHEMMVEAMKKEKILRELLIKLEGLNWCFISGTAVSVYTNNKRKFGDIDIVMDEKSIKQFSERLRVPIKTTIEKKGGATIKSSCIQTDFLGMPIEIITNFPNDPIQLNLVEKTLKNKVLRNYLSFKVYVTPLEELIAQKTAMLRKKDVNDLKLLKKLKINDDLLNEFKELWKNLMN